MFPRTRRVCAVLVATALATSAAAALSTSSADAAQPGDAQRFDSWIGYDVGRYPQVAAMGDFNSDGRLDVAWGMDAWSPNHMSVSLNIGDGSLASAKSYDAGNETADLAVADLDGDGDLDIIGASQGDYINNENIDLYLNNGSGAFDHSTVVAGDEPTNLAIADLDGDGDTDIVMANKGLYDEDDPTYGGIGVLLNNGDATFAPEVRYNVGRQTFEVVLADFDGDDVTDVAATNYDFEAPNPHQISILSGNGDGTFDLDASPQVLDATIVGSWGMAAMDAGDLDDDGDIDLALGGVSSQHDAVLTNDGTGQFSFTTYEVFGAVSIRVVDADDDGDLDVLSVGGGGGAAGEFHVQRNNGDGTLAATESGITSNNPGGLAVGDLDGDGRVDLATANRDTATGAIHRQRADGTFAAPPSGSQFAPSSEIATADFDGDGDVDIAATGQESFNDVVRIYKNDGSGNLTDSGFVRWEDSRSRQTTTVRAGDLDGDGDQDLTWMVNQYSDQRVVQALNKGDGSFAAPTARTILTCTDEMRLGDVDADGDLDEVFGNETVCGSGFDISVSYNDGHGNFGGDILVEMSWANRSIAIFDVNGDGDVDIVSGGQRNFFEGHETGDISVSLGDGTGAFAPVVYTFTGDSVTHREFAVGDFEGDGDLDIASASYYAGTQVLLNDGTGAFEATDLPDQYIHGYGNTAGIAVGDVDGDTIADIVIAHVTGSDVGINTGFGDGTFEPLQVRYGLRPRVNDVELADLNGDGSLDIISPATLSGFGPTGDDVADSTDATAPGVLVLKNRKPACTIKGTPGADVLRGTKKTDVICGAGGDDTIKGLGGGDILRGGPGNDKLVGGDGIDVLNGEQGNDTLVGGSQDDRLRGASGDDNVRGNGGRDVIDLLDGAKGNDTGKGGGGSNHCRADKKDTLTQC